MKKELSREEEIKVAYTDEMLLMIEMDKLDQLETSTVIKKKEIQKKLQLARDRVKSIKFN